MAFADALDRVRAGADPGKEAQALLAELTPEEKLWLLDGDDDFWPGLAEMSAGYNLRPILMGAGGQTSRPQADCNLIDPGGTVLVTSARPSKSSALTGCSTRSMA